MASKYDINIEDYMVNAEDFKNASPEMKKFVREINESIEAIEGKVDSPVKKLYYITRLLEAVNTERKKRGLI
jgi:hypothetical protein